MSRAEGAVSNGNAPVDAAAATAAKADVARPVVKRCGAGVPSSGVDLSERVDQMAPSPRSSVHGDATRDQSSSPPFASVKVVDCAGVDVVFEQAHETAGTSTLYHFTPSLQAMEANTEAHPAPENMMCVDSGAERRSSSANGAASSPTPSASSSRLTSLDDGSVPSPRLAAYDISKPLGSTTPNEQDAFPREAEPQAQEQRRGIQLRSFQQFQVPNPPDLPQHPSHADWIAANHDRSTTSSIKGDVPDKLFECDECGKAFARKSDLLRHSHIHSNIRQVSAREIALRAFMLAARVIRKLTSSRTFDLHSPFVCSFPGCEKDFIQRSALTVHFRVHTGERPHVCTHLACGKAFSDSSSLARHRRTHTGAKPFQCEVPECGKKFCRKITLTKHVRREHVPGGRLPRYRGATTRRKLRSGPYSEHQNFEETTTIQNAERLLGWASRSAADGEPQDHGGGSLGRGDSRIGSGAHTTQHPKGRSTEARDQDRSRESAYAFDGSSRRSQGLPKFPDQCLSPYDPPSVGTSRDDSLSQQLQSSAAVATSCAIKPVHPQLASLQAFYMESLGSYPQQAQASISYEARAAVSYPSTNRGTSSSSSFASSCDTMSGAIQDRQDGHEPQPQWAQPPQSLRYHGDVDGSEYANFSAALPMYPSTSSLPHIPNPEVSRGPTDSFGAGSDPVPNFRRYPSTWPPSVNAKAQHQDPRSSTHFYGDDASGHAPVWPTLGSSTDESRNEVAAQSNVLDDHSNPCYSLNRGLWAANASARRVSQIPLPEAEFSLVMDDGRLGGELRQENAPPAGAVYATSSVMGGVSIDNRVNLANCGFTRGRVSV
ncbi:BZ3500_MvSof-1268-A1-R1_Chr4-2g07068 [Microbotryum saponariae]|uniref:BZ3500_MvSof-1268-A1-R1_Chr4-2g07068 protein n=1 Tax=Microbotryum saponariae TaxID=289078 RepID=A0A2X0LE86_9BASI|nr:BZ3500_MvSof-1268-A1-R1_Chr4-2g07068 [Microbotryum saponariae]SDA06733.1 BZ3501_MvSof-1269-A2-R1_Chr4-2g06779 [Microbotryum saponariae]